MHITTPFEDAHDTLKSESSALYNRFMQEYLDPSSMEVVDPASLCGLTEDQTYSLAAETLKFLGYDASVTLQQGGNEVECMSCPPSMDELHPSLVPHARKRIILNYLVQAAATAAFRDATTHSAQYAEDNELDLTVVNWVHAGMFPYVNFSADMLRSNITAASQATGSAYAVRESAYGSRRPIAPVALGTNYPMLVHEGVKADCDVEALWRQFGDTDLKDDEIAAIYSHADTQYHEIPQIMVGIGLAAHAFGNEHPLKVITHVAAMSPDDAVDWAIDVVASVKDNPIG